MLLRLGGRRPPESIIGGAVAPPVPPPLIYFQVALCLRSCDGARARGRLGTSMTMASRVMGQGLGVG